jgi:hypothetical protein
LDFLSYFGIEEVYELAGRNVVEHGRISLLHPFQIYKVSLSLGKATSLYSVLKEW